MSFTQYSRFCSTTTVVTGILLGNTTYTVKLTADTVYPSDTSGGGNNEANQDVELINDVPIPVGSSLELRAGGKVTKSN